jgi:small membrane protein
MITLIQIMAVGFVTFAMSRAILRAKDKKISTIELFFWLAIWGGLIIVVFFPGITSVIADIVGIGRGIDVIVYTSIGLLFYLIFRLYVKLEEVEREITLVIRDNALHGKKKK